MKDPLNDISLILEGPKASVHTESNRVLMMLPVNNLKQIVAYLLIDLEAQEG